MSRAERLALIDRHDPALPVTRQCGLLTVSRSSVYRPPAPASDEDLAIMALIDRQYLARPYYGSGPLGGGVGNPGPPGNPKRGWPQNIVPPVPVVAVWEGTPRGSPPPPDEGGP